MASYERGKVFHTQTVVVYCVIVAQMAELATTLKRKEKLGATNLFVAVNLKKFLPVEYVH